MFAADAARQGRALAGGAAPLGRRRRRRAYTGAAASYPNGRRSIDERGTLTFEEVHRRTNALARELQADGIGEGDGVAIMCRNHRGFVEATVACSKLGASALYLNTAFAGPQIADVIAREDPRRADLRRGVRGAGERRRAPDGMRFVAWSEAREPPASAGRRTPCSRS